MAARSLLNRISGLAFAALLIAPAVQAQKGPTGSTGGSTGGGAGAGAGAGAGNIPSRPSPNTPNNPNNPTGNQQQQQPGTFDRRPIFLSGRVVTSDGTPPPDSVTIERVCGGRIRPEGYTDRKGRFSFEVGANNGMMLDASMSGSDASIMGAGNNTMTRSMGRSSGDTQFLAACELRANLPGYRSSIVQLSNHRSLDNPDVGTIVLTRLENVEGLTISATTAMAPKDAQKAFEKGKDEFRKNKPAEAEKQFAKATESYPKYAVAWFELGRLQAARGDITDARTSFQKAIDADAKYVSPYESMARLLARENKWQEVADATEHILHMNPYDFPDSYFLNSVAKLNLQHLDEAQKSGSEYLRLVSTPNRNPMIYQVMGLIYAQKQDWEPAVANLQQFIELAPPGTNVDRAKKQLAEAQKMASTAAPQAKKDNQ